VASPALAQDPDTGEGTDDSSGEAQPAPAPTVAASTSEAPPPPPPKDTTDLRAIKAGGGFGLGFAIGSLNGLSVRIWPQKPFAVSLQIGTTWLLNAVAIVASPQFTIATLSVPESPVTLLPYAGPTFRVRLVGLTQGLHQEYGGGFTAGCSVVVATLPVELFFEVSPIVAGSVNPTGSAVGFGIDGLVGMRFYP